MKNQKKLFREFRFESEAQEDERELVLSISSEMPVERWFGREVLEHTEAAIDLSRLNNSAPVLLDHDPQKVIGVFKRAWL